MSQPTMKQLREQAEAVLADGVKNKAQLIAALPALVALQEAVKNHQKLIKDCRALAEALSDACSDYALDHTSVFDRDLLELTKGTLTGDLTVDDMTYHFVNGIGAPKREDGQNLSQAFLASLPKGWTKSKLEANLANVSDEELGEKGLYRPAKNSWEAA